LYVTENNRHHIDGSIDSQFVKTKTYKTKKPPYNLILWGKKCLQQKKVDKKFA